MSPDILRDVLDRLSRDFQFKEVKGWLRGGRCPQCGKKELYTNAENPWVVRCGRLTNCAYTGHVKDMYQDLFEHWSTRYQEQQKTNPNAAADAYMHHARGFDLARVKGWYTQESYFDNKKNAGSATVRFQVGSTWWERLIDQPSRFDKKARFKYGGSYSGQWWCPPDLDLSKEKEIWLVEGIFDAIALWLTGIPAVALLTCNNYPADAMEDLARSRDKKPVLIWALDGDRAGRGFTKKWVAQARKAGWLCSAATIPQTKTKKQDWNDLFLLGKHLEDEESRPLSKSGLEKYRYHGELLLAETATAKAMLIYNNNPRRSEFELEFQNRLYWFNMDVDKYQKAIERINEERPGLEQKELQDLAMAESGGIRQIANCHPFPLYYQANETTDEAWYYYRVDFPHDGKSVKNTFTSSQLSSSGEFKKRLLAIAPGAMYSGSNQMLDRSLERQLFNIKRVSTVDFVGYSKEHGCYLLGDVAVSGGKLHKLNDEDYFDIGNVAVKTLLQSIQLDINSNPSEYDNSWEQLLWKSAGAKGLVCLAFWMGSLFAEQIRKTQKSFPFLEIVGEAGAGKTYLIEFMWRLFGRNDEEGFDPSRATPAARARRFAQLAGMPTVLIESDREQSGSGMAVKSTYDWDELKTLFNGRSVRSRGMMTGGNDTYDPPFRGALVISQNNAVQSSEAIMSRIVHVYFDKSMHSDEGHQASKALSQMPVEALSGFILKATTREAQLVGMIDELAPKYGQQLLGNSLIRNSRIAQNHGQLMAMLDALQKLMKMTDEQYQAAKNLIEQMAVERCQALEADHPLVVEFWDMYEYLNGSEEEPVLNHSRTPQVEIAINLNHFMEVAIASRQQMPLLRELKTLLKTSKRYRFVESKVVNSAIKDRQSLTGLGTKSNSERCWIFAKG